MLRIRSNICRKYSKDKHTQGPPCIEITGEESLHSLSYPSNSSIVIMIATHFVQRKSLQDKLASSPLHEHLQVSKSPREFPYHYDKFGRNRYNGVEMYAAQPNNKNKRTRLLIWTSTKCVLIASLHEAEKLIIAQLDPVFYGILRTFAVFARARQYFLFCA